MIITQHAHIYSFHMSKFNFGEIFFLIFLSIQPLLALHLSHVSSSCSHVAKSNEPKSCRKT